MLKNEKWFWSFYDETVKHVVELDNTTGEQKVFVDEVLIGTIEQKAFTPNYEYCFDVDGSNCVIFISLASKLFSSGVVPKLIVNGYYVGEYEPSGHRKKYFHVPEKDTFGKISSFKYSKHNITDYNFPHIIICNERWFFSDYGIVFVVIFIHSYIYKLHYV